MTAEDRGIVARLEEAIRLITKRNEGPSHWTQSSLYETVSRDRDVMRAALAEIRRLEQERDTHKKAEETLRSLWHKAAKCVSAGLLQQELDQAKERCDGT